MNDIHSAIAGRFHNHRYKLYNSYVFNWESDFFSITMDGKYIYEVEVKISRSDYFADFQKNQKHRWLSTAMKQELITEKGYKTTEHNNGVATELHSLNYIKVRERTPNRFYYCCPEGLIKPEELPEYAGLLYLNEAGTSARQVKVAPFIHKVKNVDKYLRSLVDKFYFQHEKMRGEYNYGKIHLKKMEGIQRENHRLQQLIDIKQDAGYISEIERLKKELDKKGNECYKLRVDMNQMLYDNRDKIRLEQERDKLLEKIKLLTANSQ